MITGQEARELTRKARENVEKRLEEARIDKIIREAAEDGESRVQFYTKDHDILYDLHGFEHIASTGCGDRYEVTVSW